MKLLKVLIIGCLILFPFGEFLRLDIGTTVGIKPLDLLVGITALVGSIWLIKQYIRKKSPDRLLKPILIVASIGAIALLINITWLAPLEFFISFLYLLRWISYAMLLLIILQFDKHFKQKLTWLLFFDGLFILVIGYLQYFFFSSLKGWYHLGWDDHMYRMFSVFLDPNFAGGFFVLYFLFVAGLLFKKPHTGRRKQIMLLSLVLLLTLLAVFLTFSRAALLMLIIGSGVLFFLLGKKKLFFLIIGVVILFFSAISSQFYIENVNIFREASSKARLENYAVAIQIIQERPLLGVGFNSYRYAKDLYGIKAGWTGAPSHADAGVDNSFLFVLATTGVIGFGPYLWLWFCVFIRLRNERKKNLIFPTVAIASVLGLFVHALFINSLFFAPLMLWLFVLLGITLSSQP
ncbi:MAG: O-antigen ligase family protein [Patescibacteria group bacterium]|mgnify:CR=1 FL=1